MSLIQSAKLNGHDPYRYLKDVLERLPTHPASRLEELLPASLATDMTGPYKASHTVGSIVRIAGRRVLNDFVRTWRLHNPLTADQLAFAGREPHHQVRGLLPWR